jgi:hypothetical protein
MPVSDRELRCVLWAAVSTAAQAEDDHDSLPKQKRDGLALIEQWHAQTVAVLEVPGHSRDYLSLEDCAEDMQKRGINAFRDLQKLMKQKAFDCLICYDGNRFARTQSLHAFIVEYIVTIMAARIYVMRTGLWVDRSNFRGFIAMDGFASASEIDVLKSRNKIGLDKRAQRGFPKQAPPISHITIRDARGKVTSLELNPATTLMFQHLKELVVAGKTWREVCRQMYYRYGHVHPTTGKPLSINGYYRLCHNPIVWGIMAQGYRGKWGTWAFDETAPVPEGVTIIRQPEIPIPPVWTGNDARLMKAELLRRDASMQGHASPEHSYMFTGLLKCAQCGNRFVYHASGHSKHPAYRCGSKSRPLYEQRCENGMKIRESRAIEQINHYLQLWLDRKQPDIIAIVETSATKGADEAQAIQSDIDSLTAEITALVALQRKASALVQEDYARQIEALAQRREILKARLAAVQDTVEPVAMIEARHLAYETLSAMGLNEFWRQESRQINQMLHALLGRARFIVDKGKIIDLR